MASLEDFVAGHGQALLRLAYLLTGRHHAAEDLFQDCLAALQRNWARVNSADAPLAYAKRTLVNEYLSARRRRSAWEVPMDDPESATDVRRDHGFETAVVERDRVWRLLADLPARERAAVVLYYYEDLSDEDAATILGCRPVTVRSNRSRALDRLRKSAEWLRTEELS